MNLKRNFLRFTFGSMLCFGLSYAFHRANPIPPSGHHGYPLSVLIGMHDALDPKGALPPGAKRTVEESFELNDRDLRKVVLHLVNTDVRVQSSKDGKFKLLFQGEKSPTPDAKPVFSHELKDGEVTIHSLESPEAPSGTFTLEIPESVMRLDLESVSGDLRGSIGSLEKLTLKTVSGQVRLESKRIRELDLRSTSGDASISAEFGRIQARSISGDLTFGMRATPVADLSFHTVSGNRKISPAIQVKSPGIPVTIETVSGDLKLDRVRD